MSTGTAQLFNGNMYFLTDPLELILLHPFYHVSFIEIWNYTEMQVILHFKFLENQEFSRVAATPCSREGAAFQVELKE